jgi:hypothetical protein
VNGAQAPVTYAVEYQQEAYDTDPSAGPGGAPVRGVRIGIVVNGTLHTSVFVPASRYTPDQVKAAISAAAANVAAIQSLTHES